MLLRAIPPEGVLSSPGSERINFPGSSNRDQAINQCCPMLYLQAGTAVLLLALGTIEVILLNPHMNKVRTEAWQAVGRLTVPRMTQICHLVGGLQGPSRPCEKSEIRGSNDPTYPHAPAAEGILTPIWHLTTLSC